MKAATLDIETSALEAVGAGFMLCAVVKPYGNNPKVFRYDKFECPPAKESRMIVALVKELEKYDLLIGHNIARFDWNYVKSRSLVLGIAIQFRPLIYDTLTAFRRVGFLTRANGFGRPSAGLGMVTDGLGIKNKKTQIFPHAHWQAVWEGNSNKRKALDEIVEHCLADVDLTEQVYDKLLKIDSNPIIRRAK